jgi:hypothetical protein
MPYTASIGTHLRQRETPQMPTTRASSGLFALAVITGSDTIGPLVAVEQASLSSITVASGKARVVRCEREAGPMPDGSVTRVAFADCAGSEAVGHVDVARIALAHKLGGPTAVSAVATLKGPQANGG